jgi:hypothetical protein
LQINSLQAIYRDVKANVEAPVFQKLGAYLL